MPSDITQNNEIAYSIAMGIFHHTLSHRTSPMPVQAFIDKMENHGFDISLSLSVLDNMMRDKILKFNKDELLVPYQ